MNPQGLASRYGATYTPPPISGSAPSSGQDFQSLAQRYGATYTPPLITDTSTSNPIADKSIPIIQRAGMFAKGLYDSIANNPTVKSIGQDYANAIPNFLEAAGSSKTNNPVSQVAEGTLRATASGLGTVFSPITRTVQGIADAVSNNKSLQQSLSDPSKGGLIYPVLDAFQKAQDAYNSFEQSNPEVARNFNDALTVALSAAGEKPVTDIGAKAGEIASKTGETVSNAVSQAGDSINTLRQSARTAIENKVVQSTANDWERIGGDYVKTDKLLTQEAQRSNNPSSVQDTPTFLAQQGISPQSLISGNKFDVAKIEDAANSLTQESVKPFEDALTAQLKVAQQGQPPVSNAEIRSQVMSNIDNAKGPTEGDRVLMRNAANRELIALQNKYPKGVPLDILNQQKGTYWSKTKFDITRPLQPQVNYNIGSAMKDIIETKAGDANVRELNGLLGNYYKSAKFLRGLEGKVPKLTLGEKIGRGVVKAGLVAGGEAVFGLSGGLGGYFLAKSVSHILENASNPLRGFILDNLQKTNPKAYTEAVKWLGEQEAQRLTRLALPAGSPQGTVNNPIIGQPPTPPPSTIKTVSAERISIKNPKTGKYERVYTSNPRK